ncbi:hypothetical protein Taro_040595 [Colocasia esculenta]|uniref:U3 small nucleolar RNA-associated protein 13 C-terminal domain-containing protein n=1 Tax=Colocasia esculenta TaxID=4460 RepID=A0A843WQW0_COLES|nr:hypothetical protein [Colocasia esculenta]
MAAAEAEAAVAEAAPSYRGLKRNYRCARSLEPFYSRRAYAVSSDGSFVACAYDDKVKLVDVSCATVRATLEGDTEEVTALALSPDDKFLFSASGSRLVRVWEISISKCVRSWKGNDGIITVMACHASGGLLATAGSDRKVLVWDVDGGFCTHFFKGHEGVITSVIFHPDPNRLLNARVRVVTAQASEGEVQLNMQKRLIGYNVDIIDMKFVGEEEKLLAVAALSEEVRIYDVATMSCSYVLAGHTDTVLCLDTCVLNTGKACIVTGSKDNSARLWNAVDRKCIGLASGHTGAVGAVAFSRKYKNFFVSGSSDADRKHGIIKVWSLDNLSETINHEIKLKAKAVVAGHDKGINCLAISPNDGLVCSGSQDRTACVWRLPDLVSVVVLKGHKRGIWSVEFSPVDQCVITASGADGLVKLWTVKTSECIATYDQHEGKVWSLAVGKKTEMLATGGSDAVINLWHDCTADDIAEKSRKAEEDVLKDQELKNAFADKDYAKTIQLAFELRLPHKLFELLSEVYREGLADDPIQKVVQALGKEELRLLLEFIREWNTKPQECHVAQSVLFRIFKVFPPTEIIKIKGIRELLEGLIPYSQRHFGRIDRLSRSTFLLDYTLAQMSVLEPEASLIPPKDDNANELAPENIGQVIDDSLSKNIGREQMQDFSDDNKSSSKKRKSNKSRKGPKKRIKDAAEGALSAIPVQG